MSEELAPRHALLLRLAGPMQSWGFRSRFDNRDTALEPTRSGVVGLLCAALGQKREDADLERLTPLKMGVRVDNPGRVMVDYQTVSDIGMQSWRYYLSDARFLVALESGDLDELSALDAALRDPIFPLFLGRKSYVPTLPVALPRSGVRAGLNCESALRAEPWLQTFPRERADTLAIWLETGDALAGRAVPDVPRSFASRSFALRYVEAREPLLLSDVLQKDELCFSRK